MKSAYFHLPGLFEFLPLYEKFLSLFFGHREYFYEWAKIASIYGSPADSLWSGGRVGFGEDSPIKVAALMAKYGISSRLTFSNSLLRPQDLDDEKCNELCSIFEHNGSCHGVKNGVIIHSALLLNYLQGKYPDFYFVSSTTKVITDWSGFESELKREKFSFVVPDFRLNKDFKNLSALPQNLKDKTEFLCNECCPVNCTQRKACYENVSRKALGQKELNIKCFSPDAGAGYVFSKAMKSPVFIGVPDILQKYLPMGFSNFKIEGRSLGSAMILEFLLYYLTKPEHQLKVHEKIYLDSSLDLF